MEALLIFKAILALALVAGAILLCAHLLKKYFPQAIQANTPKHLKIDEQLYITPKHKVITVSHNTTKYVLLIGDKSEILLDTIKPAKTSR